MHLLRLLLALLLVFVTVSSFVIGIGLFLMPDGIVFQLQPAVLLNSPFNNFLIPGVISFIITGGSSLTALLLLRDGSFYTLPAALGSGLLLVIWVGIIIITLKNISWVANAYLVIGLAVVIISLYIQKKYDDISTATKHHSHK